ncbi:cell division protein ZapE [Haloechinothrix sp. YIM 98757]|uniref:Cell division protein ZapE n=1 Tax=Haloechinothrix aidingensis TaxID=2752311 RepID=A0A838AA77_9PSEU|nr:cell division protein ZapE [Haloechinothrix aidingensis]MBA0126059.1 cell division protein ZapE [Haloechinothrix aidingensis]
MSLGPDAGPDTADETAGDTSAGRLADRWPTVGADELVGALVPPPRFDTVRFGTYIPNPDEPSQQRAVTEGAAFAARVAARAGSGARRGWRALLPGRLGTRNAKASRDGTRGLYFDGGFGVGKTHLLASLWHDVPGPKAYCTFVELTHLVGLLGFSAAVARLADHQLLAIDEFELDDPGDTMLVTRLLRELMAAGVHVAATSNTLPDKLGEGRFAAEDFLREIQALSARFEVVRVDGPDYRHRDAVDAPDPVSEGELAASAAALDGATMDDFGTLCEHLARLHPSRYGRLLDGVAAVHLSGVTAVTDQSVALRLVSFVDRLYDRAIPVVASGEPLSVLFSEEMVRGGYRKKYLRALSRLTALARESDGSA